MENRENVTEMALNRPVPPYALLFFDHLHSQYLSLRPSIQNDEVKTLLDGIHKKREDGELTWSDIYTFDLTLVDVQPPESLIRKAYDARAKYRSIAGQKEYDEYIASKPPDLTEITFTPPAQPPDPIVLLRADIKYLLSKFYLYYAVLPVRERVRDQLTKWAVVVTGFVVVLITIAILLNVGASFVFMERNFAEYAIVFVTVLTVALAGVVGGCVSMLQRIQSAPTEGDALFNLAALTNGWRGIILSPLYGGIFAALLFVLFAAGVLRGSVFPVINTPGSDRRSPAPASLPPTSPSPEATPSPASSPDPAAAADKSPQPPSAKTSPAVVTNPTPREAEKSASPTPTPSPAPSPTPSPHAKADVLQIKDFLRETGPADGVSYALLIIWSFLAGFAERLVPDTLNRLVAKNQALQGQ